MRSGLDNGHGNHDSSGGPSSASPDPVIRGYTLWLLTEGISDNPLYTFRTGK